MDDKKNWTDEQWCEYIYGCKGYVIGDGYGNKVFFPYVEKEVDNGQEQ